MIFLGDWIPNGMLATDVLSGNALKVVNLECAVAPHMNVTTRKAYPIIVDDHALLVLSRTQNVVLHVANNHTYDAGEDAFGRLLAELDRMNIAYYGTRDKPYWECELDGQRYFIVGGTFNSRSRGRLHARLEGIEDCIIHCRQMQGHVIVTPHWGGEGEYTPYPSPVQRNLARRWISFGAGAIIGHHSHSIQGMERIAGGTVFYSLGNFHFPHAESSLYPITRFGLGVEYLSGVVQRLLFFEHLGGRSVPVNDGTRLGQLHRYLTTISDDLTDTEWTQWRWARAIGKTYTDKNAASWRLRLKKRWWPTALIWLVANLLPKTLYLRLGKVCEDRQLRTRYKAFDRFI